MSDACAVQKEAPDPREAPSVETSELLPPEQGQPFSEERLSEDLLNAFSELWSFVDERSQRLREQIRHMAPKDPMAALAFSEAISKYREDMLNSINRQKNAFLRLMNLLDVVNDGVVEQIGESSSLSDPQTGSKLSRSKPLSIRLVPAMKRMLPSTSITQNSVIEPDQAFQDPATPDEAAKKSDDELSPEEPEEAVEQVKQSQDELPPENPAKPE